MYEMVYPLFVVVDAFPAATCPDLVSQNVLIQKFERVNCLTKSSTPCLRSLIEILS